MRRTELRKKVLYALAVASVATFVHGGGVPTYAATLNGHKITDGVVTNEFVVNTANSGKFVIGQGNVSIQTNANVNQILEKAQSGIESSDNTPIGILNAIREALVPTEQSAPLVGVVGGEAQLDSGIMGVVGKDSTYYKFIKALKPGLVPYMDKIANINTLDPTKPNQTKKGDIIYVVGEADGTNSPVIIGAVGGDLSVNSGLDMNGEYTSGSPKAEPTTLIRNGNVNMDIYAGNILGGTGGSAAIATGNITANYMVDIPLKFGKTQTILNGDVNVNAHGGANVGGFFNGGAAIAIGGNATSTLNGNSNFTADSNVRVDRVDGITAGITGGGAAISTIGGIATSAVNGTTNLDITNGLSIGGIGGGMAASVDATGVVEAIKGGQIGNDDGTSDTTINGITVTVADAIQGGSATATTGDTNINLTGNTTAIGVIGGGVAASTHTYILKGAETADGKYKQNDAYGSSKATANTGKATIVVNLDSQAPDNVAANIGGALSSVIDAVKDGNLNNINADGVVGQGAAVGVFGGGVAFGHGSYRSFIGSEDAGAYSIANNKDGADIYLLKGYAAGVFGGGAAGTLNNAKAETNTGVVNTYVGEDMKAVGIFGGGFALSMEGETSNIDTNGTEGTLASSNVEQNNIVVDGDVDGIYGGGMAIGNSNLGRGENVSDAATHVGTTNITVNKGTVDRLQLISIMQASKNDNTDGAPWWNHLGMNASMAMADLKGITDETSIAAGGMGMGMTGSDTVDVANVTINGGTITKDILGGGIAVDNMRDGSGAHVGTSTITLNGGTVGGSVYAGGAINGTTPSAVDTSAKWGEHGVEGHKRYNTDATSSTVGEATVVLNGTAVTGEISGQGYEMTTKYNPADDNDFNPFDSSGKNYEATYEKEAYDNSVTDSTLVIKGINTLSALDTTKGDYVSDGSKIHSFNEIHVEADSVTKLDGKLQTGQTALIDGGKVTVADSAILDVSELQVSDGTYNVAQNYENGSTFWKNEDLQYDRFTNYAETVFGDATYGVKFSELTDENKDDAANGLADFLNAGAIKPLIDQGYAVGWDNVNAGAYEYFHDWNDNAPAMNAAFGRGMMIGEDSAVTGNTSL